MLNKTSDELQALLAKINEGPKWTGPRENKVNPDLIYIAGDQNWDVAVIDVKMAWGGRPHALACMQAIALVPALLEEVIALRAKAEAAAGPDIIQIPWTTEDVLSVAPHLTHEQAREVLHEAAHKHDATTGINWDVLTELANWAKKEGQPQ